MDLTKYQNSISAGGASTFAVKAQNGGRIEGYASTFGGEADVYGDVIAPGAFSKSLQEHEKRGTSLVMLWSHRMEEPVGRWTRAFEDQRGLYVEGQLNLDTARGKEAFAHVSAGDVTGLSIGAIVPEGTRKYDGKGLWVMTELDVYEVSLVAIPANRQARITGVKTIGSKIEAIDMLRDCGLSRRAAEKFANGGFPALHTELDQIKAMDLARMIDAKIDQMRNS